MPCLIKLIIVWQKCLWHHGKHLSARYNCRHIIEHAVYLIWKPYEKYAVKAPAVICYPYKLILCCSYELILPEKILTGISGNAKLRENNQQIIDMLGTVVEYRNLESGEHIKRVKGYTGILAECAMKEYPEYGLTEEKIHTIVAASSLHDIGKITIPDSILLKPGRLTEDEYEYMKSHTIRGCELLDEIDQEWEPDYKKVSYEICRHHHERYDGKGYPDGLKGEEIPISAQLVSVADVYDALVNERCYKDAYSPDEAYRMIINGECGVFSPKLMEVFRKVRRDFEEMK